MAKDFGMEFEKRFGKWEPETLVHLTGATGYKLYVHPDSVHLLTPQRGDLVFYDNLHGGEAWDEVSAIIPPDDERYPYVGTGEPLMLMDGGEHPYVKELRRIIQRQGTPFFWPESEPDAA
jgi:hypothetical protein